MKRIKYNPNISQLLSPFPHLYSILSLEAEVEEAEYPRLCASLINDKDIIVYKSLKSSSFVLGSFCGGTRVLGTSGIGYGNDKE